jgi:hypothetical protein
VAVKTLSLCISALPVLCPATGSSSNLVYLHLKPDCVCPVPRRGQDALEGHRDMHPMTGCPPLLVRLTVAGASAFCPFPHLRWLVGAALGVAVLVANDQSVSEQAHKRCQQSRGIEISLDVTTMTHAVRYMDSSA